MRLNLLSRIIDHFGGIFDKDMSVSFRVSPNKKCSNDNYVAIVPLNRNVKLSIMPDDIRLRTNHV